MTKLPIATWILTTAAGIASAGDAKAPEPRPVAKPAVEIGEMAKSMTGNWKCEGTFSQPDGKPDKVKLTGTTKADLDGFWVHDSMVGGSDKGPKFKMEAFTTYDAAGKKWRRVAVMNDGGQMVGTADPMKDMKMEFLLDSWSPMGSGLFKDHVDMSDLKKGAHLWGELSIDHGKSWVPVYDLLCKK